MITNKRFEPDDGLLNFLRAYEGPFTIEGEYPDPNFMTDEEILDYISSNRPHVGFIREMPYVEYIKMRKNCGREFSLREEYMTAEIFLGKEIPDWQIEKK